VIVAVVLGAAFLAYAVALARDVTPARAMRVFGFSITYLTALFVAMGLDAVIHIR
jgi:heme o synthase